MPSLVNFSSSSRQRSISLDSQESTHHRPQHHSYCAVVEQDASESSSILQDDDDRTTRFVPETHSDEFVSATTATTTTSFRPPFPRRGKTVRFASASTNQYYTDTAGVYTNEEVKATWYTKQEVTSLRQEMRQAAKAAAHDTLWVNAMLKAYVGCCSKTTVADVRKMVVKASSLSCSSSSFDVMMVQQDQPDDDDDNTDDGRMLGLEMAALPSLSADRQIRKDQIYQRIQQLQQQQCNNSSAATTTAERISMVSRSLSRPSRLFAYYTAMMI